MRDSGPESKANQVILQDAIQRDRTTARRFAMLEILWSEHYLTRSQIITRLEFRLGKNCFGKTAWEDNFWRDMRVLKQAFSAAGQSLVYSRRKKQSGYYLVGQPAVSADFEKLIQSSAAEIDPHQINIYRRLSAADRFHQGCSTSDTARLVVAYRIRQENPDLDPVEAHRLALQRAYQS